jgi:hypothetical protein
MELIVRKGGLERVFSFGKVACGKKYGICENMSTTSPGIGVFFNSEHLCEEGALAEVDPLHR